MGSCVAIFGQVPSLEILIAVVTGSDFEVFDVFGSSIGNFLVFRGEVLHVGDFWRLVEIGWIWSRWLGDAQSGSCDVGTLCGALEWIS